MLLFPTSKINLGLSILNKREDGYHNLESIFLPIPLFDSLEFIESKTMKFQSSIPIDEEKSNSILKAYELLSEDFSLPPLSIFIHKNIPIGAGLGGGSADGAFMLTGLNQYFNLGISTPQLERYALQIGSDCPFFIDNTPKLVHGTGDILSPIEMDLYGYHLVLINPNIHVSTQQAFEQFNIKQDQRTPLELIVNKEPIENWKSLIHNDFEESIFNQFPEIEELKTKLYQTGAIYASMTGTGSTVYGLFNEKIELDSFPTSYFKTQFKL